MIDQRKRQEKITRVKLQTAKVLWQESRKDAAFLVLESIDDPRADELRDKMGFDEYYEVGLSADSRSHFSLRQVAAAVVLVGVLAFGLGFLVSPDNSATVVDATPSGNDLVATIIAPTPAPGETLSQPLLDLTATTDANRPTHESIQTQSANLETQIWASETAKYRQATERTNARETEAADSN